MTGVNSEKREIFSKLFSVTSIPIPLRSPMVIPMIGMNLLLKLVESIDLELEQTKLHFFTHYLEKVKTKKTSRSTFLER